MMVVTAMHLDELIAELQRQATNIHGNAMIEVDVVQAIIARHVQPAKPSPDRAALVQRMARAIEQQFDLGYTATALDFATVALASVDAAGWGPKPEGAVCIDAGRWERVPDAAEWASAHTKTLIQPGDLDAEP